MKKSLLLSVPIAAACLFPARHGQAQDNLERIVNPNPRAVAAYWTPELLKAATPFPMPHPAPGASAGQAAASAGQAQSGDAHAPALQVRVPVRRLFTPASMQERAVATPHAGNYLTYTSTRVFPMFDGAAAPYSADRAYPYITVGRLFFTAGGKPMFCSASVIQRRIVVTAGHCVHSGTSSGFFSNWMFVPAYRDGNAPLLTWTWRAATVTGTWAFGGGTVPNAADYAMIEFADQPVGRTLRALGDVTGWLGWRTLTLTYNHTSKLGYPCNLDNCQKMQDITGNAHGNSPNNTVVYGSDAANGSDGGPWVQNFQQLQAGGGTGYFAGPNQVVGVSSYSESANGTHAQGASIPDGRWINILNTLCSLRAGNCI
jgi:V8-like Glu-specific endopeptidase